MDCFQFCFNFAVKFNLRRYMKAGGLLPLSSLLHSDHVAGAYTPSPFSSTLAVSDTKYTLTSPHTP
jgi:hypothetical protein